MLPTQTNTGLLLPNRRTADRRPNTQPTTGASTAGAAIATLLSTPIAPIRHGSRYFKGQQARFYRSAHHLCAYYGWEPLQPSEQWYPLNMLSDFEILKERLKEASRTLDLFVCDTPGREGTIFTSKQMIEHGYLLNINYYYEWICLGDDRPLADMLRATFHYIYAVAGVALFCDEDNDVYHCYNTLFQMIYEEGEEEHMEYASELEDIMEKGYDFGKSVGHKDDLKKWAMYLAAFQPKDQWQTMLKVCCAEFYNLYCQFPDDYLQQHIDPDLYSDDCSGVIPLEYKIAMTYDASDYISEFVEGMIDCDQCDRETFKLPAQITFFDKVPKRLPEFLPFENLFYAIWQRLYDFSCQYHHHKTLSPCDTF